MEQKQRENEEYIARKNAEIAEFEKDHEKLKARLQELQLKTEEKKAQDLKSEIADMKNMIMSCQKSAEESIAALGEQMQTVAVKYMDIGKSLNERLDSHLQTSMEGLLQVQTVIEQTVLLTTNDVNARITSVQDNFDTKLINISTKLETLKRTLMNKLEGKEDRKPTDDSGYGLNQETSSTGTSTKNETVQNMPDVSPEVFEKLPKEMTVVLLGETGVGKSTFINGLVNYLKYATLHEAQQKGVEILIKAYFTLTDEYFNRLEIKCEPTIKVEKSAEVENEVTEAGTQLPKSYKFVWSYGGEERVIRIIDTPGLRNVRGVEQEKENFHQILSFLADFKKINAICILLRPNERLALTSRYCINELLSHLHVSAARNILFCFTNARQTLYCPGETLGALESHLAILRKKRQIDIPLNKNTMFCFDNESFRFLCALNKGAKFNAKEVENFNESWIKTVEETFRLFGRIAELDAHDVEKTLSVNNIRSVILALSRPLAEIVRYQLLTAKLIDNKTKEIQTRVDEGKDLTGRLYVDQVKIEIQKPPAVEKLFIEILTKKKEELIKESEKISSHSSEFAAFLRKNSILPYNDAYKDYVDPLILEEMDKEIKDNGVLDQLKNYKEEYEQQVKILDEQQEKDAKVTKSIKQIYAMVNDLKRLPHSGKVLEDIQKLEMMSVRDREINTSTSVNLNGGWLDNFSPRKRNLHI